MTTSPNNSSTTAATKVGGMKNLAALDVLRRDIAKVVVVDTDFVIQMKSGRKILIRDGALRSATEEDFKLVFSDNEVVSGKEFFGVAQNLPVGNIDANWADTAISDISSAEVSTASLVTPAVAAGSSLTTVAIVGGIMAAAGGGGGGSSGSNNSAQITALKTIADFARENTVSMPTPVGSFQYKAGIATPTITTYADAKITGITNSNIAAINDALATANVTDNSVNTTEKLQTVVNAYGQIISLANGAINTDILPPTYTQYQLIGVTGLDATTTQATKLLTSVIDLKRYADIDTVIEIQALADIAKRLIASAAGNATVTAADLEALGLTLTGVLDFSKVLSAIALTNDNGTGVDSVEELQTLIDGVVGTAVSALQSIVEFAQANTNSAPTPPVVGVVVPVTSTYQTAGALGVSDTNVASINDALMTANVNGTSVNTLAKLQALVDAYNSLMDLADGIGNNASDAQKLTVSQLTTIGAQTAELLNANPSNRIDLLKSMMDGQMVSGVETIKAINALINITNAIQDAAQGITSTHTLTAEQLTTAGVAGVTNNNLEGFLKAIQGATTDNTNSIFKLQDLLYKNLSLNFTGINQDTGFDPHDFVTTDTLLDLSGTSNAADGTNIRITISMIAQTDVVLNSVVIDGKWLVSNTNNATQSLSDGIYTVKAELLDSHGHTLRTQAFTQTVTIDNSADRLPDGSPDPELAGKIITFTDISPDTGEPNDFKTSITRVKFSGTSTASAGTHVGLTVDGVWLSTPSVTWENTGTGVNKWQIDFTGQELSAGTHSVDIYLTDAAGNKLLSSKSSHDVVIDTAGLSLLSKTSGAIATSSNLVLTFSSAVKAGEAKYIHLTDETTGAVITDVLLTGPQVRFSNQGVLSTFGTTVTIDFSNDLVAPRNYHATIDKDAFVTEAGVSYEGLSYSQSTSDWRFQAVDPSTTIFFSGTTADISNGLNADELNSVTISGTISGANLLSVSNAKISKLIFTASDGSNFEVTQGLPGVIDLRGDKTWTLANDTQWTNKLLTGKTYTVQAQLDSVVSGDAQTSYATSAPVAVDRIAPVLTSIVCDDISKTSFKSGDSAVFTLTFSEDPGNSLTPDEIAVTSVGGKAVGSITALYGTGNRRKVLFRAAENTNFTPTDGDPIFKVINSSFSDAAGNVGSVVTGVSTPNLRIDTQAPVINSVTISGLQKNGSEISSGTLIEGEKIRVTAHMSEATTVVGTPTFNIVVGNSTKQANYVMRNGNDLMFEYTVSLGDADNTGGITVSPIGLLTTSSRVTDLVGNEADLKITTVPVSSNTLKVVTTGANDALSRIVTFADVNIDPSNIKGTPPTVDDYLQAGVVNVDINNVDAINNSLATDVINGVSTGDVQSLQNLVTAYKTILDLANSKDDVLHSKQPNYLQYGLIGVQGVDSLRASLLGDVIDRKKREDVDTVSEVQDLANAADAVINLTQKIDGLTVAQLTNKLGVLNVTEDNFAAVSRAIAQTSPTGSDVDSLEKLQSVVDIAVNKAIAALNALTIFAEANQNPLSTTTITYTGVKPTWAVLNDAGIDSIAGVSDNKMADMVADALATSSIKAENVSTSTLLQGIVSAYGAIALLANSQSETPIDSQPRAMTYKLIGVAGFEDVTLPFNIHKAKLLSDVIDRKALTDIDTVLEIQAIAEAASAVLANAAGNGTASVTQFILLGLDVPVDKLVDVTTAITETLNDGSEVDSFGALSTIISSKLGAVDQAVRVIATFADQNTASQPTPTGVYKGDAPTAQTYVTVGVSGPVSDTEAQAFNDALATSLVTYKSVDTAQEIKDLAAAYRAVLNLADSAQTTGGNKPTALQYNLLGVTGFDPGEVTDAFNSANRASLLGDVIDQKINADVNTILQIQAIANNVGLVMDMAKGVDGLTLSALNQMGMTGVTADNLAAVKQAINVTLDDGSAVNTLAKLQIVVTAKVNQFNSSLGFIQQYASTHVNPSELGSNQPTVQNYLDLGLLSVTAINLEAINSTLATQLVTNAEVNTAQAVSAVVNAYADILKAANGTYNPGSTLNPNVFSLLGISGVGSSAVKLKLLSDVIDRQSESGVNTAVKLQTLADKVTAVMNTAANAATGGITQAQQLLDLGLFGVTPINLNLVIAAIQKTNVNGAGVDTVEELQNIVNNVVGAQTTAMNVLITFAGANTSSKSLTGDFFYKIGVAIPTEQHYMDAGIAGIVNANEANAFNDALATDAITASSIADVSKLQVVVDAYRKVSALADGPLNPTSTSSLLLADLQNIGADISVLNNLTGEALLTRLRLLNDTIDRKNTADVDTIAELNQLIKIISAIQDQAAGTATSYIPTATDFANVGIEGVTASNLAVFLFSIKTAGPSGADSLNELQTVLNGSLSVAMTAVSEDRGVSVTDFITSDNTLNFSGTSSATNGSIVKLILKKNATIVTELNATVIAGVWQITDTVARADGMYTVDVQLFNGKNTLVKTGAQGHVSIDTSFDKNPDGSIDTTLAGMTIDFNLSADTDSGTKNDYKTSSTQLKFIGTSNAGDGTNVALSIDGVMNYTKVNGGIWEVDYTSKTLGTGAHIVIASLVDASGNAALTGASGIVRHDVTIDSTALTLTNKTNGAMSSVAPLVLNFSDSVTAQASKFIKITDDSNNAVVDTIAVKDITRVSITGNVVTVNAINGLTPGQNYHATLDAGAFLSPTGSSSSSLGLSDNWRLTPADPTTSISFSGVGVTPNDGINATEFANLTVNGTATSALISAVQNIRISKIVFTNLDLNPNDVNARFEVITGMPVVDPTNFKWTLVREASWTSKLQNGRYTVSAEVAGEINNITTTRFSDISQTSLIDTSAPTLLISNTANTIISGESSTYTFTFSEVPVGFTQSDIMVATTNGTPTGTLSNFSTTLDPKVFTVVFTPTAGITLPRTAVLSIAANTFNDGVGNNNDSSSTSPSIQIDTQAPVITSISLIGIDSTNQPSNALQLGDKVRVSIALSEATLVTGMPVFTLQLGSTTKSATYVNGTGTNTLVFEYIIVLGDTAKTGSLTAPANALALSGSTLKDTLGNSANISFAAVNSGNQIVIETNADALAALSNAAQSNNASDITTPLSTYVKAGVTGVDGYLSAINSALNSGNIGKNQTDTTSEIQTIVDAYKAILALADGSVSTSLSISALQYSQVGVTGVNETTTGAATVTASIKAKLLSDAIDIKQITDVNTTPKLQALSDAVSAVMLAANGYVSGVGVLTKDQLILLGIKGVNENNLSKVLAAIDSTNDNGSAVDTLEHLQAVVNNSLNIVNTAMQVIIDFADNNNKSAPDLPVPSITVPGVSTYEIAGVTGVNVTNVASINDALMTDFVNGEKVSTVAGLQAIIDTYSTVLTLADGRTNNATSAQNLTAPQLSSLGVNTTGLSGNNATNRMALLKSLIDGQKNTGVDTITEINNLVRIANAIQDQASGVQASNLTATDFATLGIEGVSTSNLAAYLTFIKIATTSGVISLDALQTLLNNSLSVAFTSVAPDSGVSSSDLVTKESTLLVFNGTSSAANGTKIVITITAASTSPIVLDATVIDGAWHVTYSGKLTDGYYSVETQLRNSSDVVIRTAPSRVVTIDSAYDKTPDGSNDTNLVGKTIDFNLSADTDSGTPSDYKTSNTRLKFGGISNASNGTYVALNVDGAVTYTTVNSGIWNVDYTATSLDAKVHIIIAALVDAAGNQATAGTSTVRHDVTIDSTALTLTNKTNGAMSSVAPLLLNFSDSVTAQASKFIKIMDDSNNAVVDTIAVNDTTRVSIAGNVVRVNAVNGLTPGQNYHATLDAGAFLSPTGSSSSSLVVSDGWRLIPADPTTSISFSGVDVTPNDGINATEFANLTVNGTVTSALISAVQNIKISKIIFTNTDDGSTFTETNGISSVDPTNFKWTLSHADSWIQQLQKGHYTVTAEVIGEINNITSMRSSVSLPSILLDKVAPTLLNVTVDKSNLKMGETAAFTLTFDEDPGSTLTPDDLIIPMDTNSVPMGNIRGIAGSGLIRTVYFEPTANTTNSGVTLQLKANSFADAVNNIGTTDPSVVWATLSIDTIAPFVTGINISGVNGLTNTAIKTTDVMVVGDIIQVSVDMNEFVIVSDVPIFNIDVGGVSKVASYNRTKSTGSNLVFTYTVSPGDVDNNDGISANSNSLSLGSVGRIVDTAGNTADITTRAVLPGSNSLHLSTTLEDPFTTIQNFAQNNSNPDPTSWIGTVPSVNHYAQTRVVGVDTSNVDAINTALATSYLNAIQVDNLTKLQGVVDAYNTILALADEQESVPTLNNPSYTMYGLIGVQGVDSGKGYLLTDVIDLKNKTDVDTVPEIQALADAVTAVKNAALNGTSMSQVHLEKLGIKNLTTDNFDVALKAIINTHDFFKVDTLDELNDVISTAITSFNSALSAIKLYALNNTGITPTKQQYINAGITGVTDSNLVSINSALASATVTDLNVSRPLQIQSLVNAYNKVIEAADNKNNIATVDNMVAAQYALIGVTGVDSDVKKSLLGDVIDLQLPTGVDTANKVQALADAVTAVMSVANGNTTALSQVQLQSLGVDLSGVTDFSKVIAAIDATNDDGTGVATLDDLQLLISRVIGSANTALQVIVKFAEVNKASSPALPDVGTTVPDVSTYDAAGVVGVMQSNVAAINDALMTLSVNGAAVGTTAKLQAIIDTYKTVLALADGTANNATIAQTFTVAQLTGMGVDTTGLVGSSNDTTRLNLLKNIIDGQKTAGVYTITAINQLVKITNAIQDQAIGKATAYTLTAADFTTLGIEGVSTSNLNAYLTNIQTAGSGGADSLIKLQTLLNNSLTLVFTAITPDTGIDSADFTTKENTGLILSGTSNAVDGSKVNITLNASSNSITIDATVIGGVWQTASQPKFSDGVYTVSAALLNSIQHPIRTVVQSSFIIDTSANGADDIGIAGKTIDFTTITPDAGILNDFKTNTGLVVLSGTSTAANGANVALSMDGTLYYTTVQNGAWSVDFNLRPLSAAVHKVQASLIDKAGNVAASSVMRDLEISTSSLTLENKTTGSIAKASNLTLTFSDNVVARTGKSIQIIDETTGQPMETILVTDTNRVTIEGKKVTINPTADLTLGKTYHTTIDSEAFETVTGTKYAGLAGTDWSFRPVDPTTSVNFGGTNVITGDGINASEINNLAVSGTVTSSNIVALNNLKITKLSFTSTNGGTSFDIATIDLPVINATNYGWTLASNASWQTKLTSGKNYTVTAQVEGDIGTTHTSTTVSSASIVVDTEAPQLTITGNKTVVKVGESMTYTFTFTDVPLGFEIGDIVVNNVSNTPLGTLSNFTPTADAKLYTVVFTPNVVVNQLNISPISVMPSSYTDSTGNFGSALATAPVVLIDTKAPGNVSFNTAQGASQPADAAFFNKNDTANASGKVIAPNINKPIDTDISTITVVVGGADLAFDSLVFGSITLALNLSNNGSNITVGVVTGISWNYNASTNTLTLQKTGTSTFTADNVNAIERDLRFKTNTTPSQTPRSFTFTHTDAVGNVSGSGTQTLNVDTIVLANDWNSTLASTQQTDTSFFNKANLITSKNILPVLTVPIAETDIVNLKIDASSATVVTSDQLLFGSVTHNFGAAATTGTTIIGTLTIDWAMTAARVLNITKNGGGAFSAAEINAIQADLRFQTTATSQTARVFGFSRTDLAGNVSSVSTISLTVDTVAPQNIDLTYLIAGVDLANSNKFAIKDIATGITIAPLIIGPSILESDIASIRIGLGGVWDNSADTLVLGANAFLINGSPQTIRNASYVNVSGGVDFKYDGNLVLTLSKNNGQAFTSSEATYLARTLQFKTTSTLQGNRTVSFRNTDQAGNASADSTITVSVDTLAPTAPDLDNRTAATIDVVASSYFAINNSPTVGFSIRIVDITPYIALPKETDIFNIMLSCDGLQSATDSLLHYSTSGVYSLSFVSSNGIGNMTENGVGYYVIYSTNQIIFQKISNEIFTPAEAQAFVQNIYFGTSTTSATSLSQLPRNISISYIDSFGNAGPSSKKTIVVDTLAPVDIDLRSDISLTQITDTAYYNVQAKQDGSKLIAPNVATPTDGDIGKLQIGVLSGVPTDYQLKLGGLQLVLTSGDARSGTTTFSTNLQLNWNISASRVITLSKTIGGAFTSTELVSVEKALTLVPSTSQNNGANLGFNFTHIDLAGNNGNTSTVNLSFDTVAPVVNIANTLTISNNSGSTAILLKGASATVTESNTLQNVQIKAKNLRDGSNEKLIIGGAEIDASGATASSGTVSLTGATWNWTYNATGVFTFALNSGLAITPTAAALLQSISYRNAAGATATDEARQFVVTTTDVAGNTSAESAATVVINAFKPSLASSNSLVLLDANNDGVKGDQFVIRFGELVKASNLASTSAWALSSGTWGANASITAIDTITINGNDYATSFWVNTGGAGFVSSSPGPTGYIHITVPDQYYLIMAMNYMLVGMTLETWLKVDTLVGAVDAPIFGLLNNENQTKLLLAYNADGTLSVKALYSESNTLNTSYSYKTANLLTTNTWLHVATTIDTSGASSMYLNGVQVATSVAGAFTNAYTNALWEANMAGALSGVTTIKTGFSLADYRIYSGARTSTQIASDMQGDINLSDTNLKQHFSFNNTLNNDVVSLVGNAILVGASSTPTPNFEVNAVTLTANSTNVIDAGGSTATTNQVVALLNSVSTAGTKSSEAISGGAGNDFIAGHGGNDTLTGGTGADTFAWLSGETGSDTVTDIKVIEGDMINLSSLLQSASLGPNSLASVLSKYMQFVQSSNNAVLTIDPTGASNFLVSNPSLKTIAFTNGWSTGGLNDTVLNLVANKVINLNYQNATPLMLDLNDDGVHTTSVDQGVAFDIEGNGQVVQTAWSDGNDGFLILDVNGDGRINSGRELFGNGTLLSNGSKARDGFEALAQYDKNQDGVIDINDSVFANLKVWVDANHDGVSSASELHTLNALGVQNIQLSAKASQLIDNGNPFPLVSHWTDTAGHQHALADVLLTTSTQLKHSVVI